ncbi:MAG TPA: AAA family ATPase, partial [Chloroflexaceae bacterium]|nr:AAA family ATPase [Chloroflexaceae bacterium]
MLPLFQATRYHLPLPPGRLTPRPRLFARLDQAVAPEGGLALVTAPPGRGKSTLVSAWLAARGAPWVWLSLEAADNEPRRLLSHLVIALEAVAPAAGARLLPRLAAAPTADSAEDGTILTELLALLAELPGPVVMALDDAHVLADGRARALLARLATGAPPTLRLVVITTAELPAALAAPVVLDEAALRFSAAEAADLLGWGMGLRLAPEEAAALARRAHGSPADLLRCALALQGHPEPGRLIAALAADRRSHLEGLLQRLLAADLGQGALEAFHRRASLWHEDGGLIAQAVRHAFAGHDLAFAAELLERQGIALLERGEQSALAAWCRSFPDDLFAARPRLCLIHAWCLVLAPGAEGRELVERRLAQAERGLPEADEATRSWVIGHRANLRGHLLLYAHEPDFEALIAHSRQAMATLPEDDAAIRSVSALRIAYGYLGLSDAEGALHALDMAQRLALKGRNYSGAISCVFDRARVAHQRGRLREAAQQCRLWKEAFPRLAQDAGPIFPASGCLDLALGCVLLEQGDLAGAAACLGRGLELTGGIVQFAVVGYPALARLHEARGDLPAAAAALARLQALWPDTAPYVGGLLALL